MSVRNEGTIGKPKKARFGHYIFLRLELFGIVSEYNWFIKSYELCSVCPIIKHYNVKIWKLI